VICATGLKYNVDNPSASEAPWCKGTSICFLTSPILSHSLPVHMYSPSSPLYYLQGPYLKPTTSRPNGPTTLQKSTH
jgi:hypothetical protein